MLKKSDEGFLSKLFKNKKIDEFATELAKNYAEKIQENLFAEGDENGEELPVPMLEIVENGEVDFTSQNENLEGESPSQSTNSGDVKKHIITFRVNDEELDSINRRYAETSFKSRGVFCRYSALTVMNVEEDTEGIKQISKYISSISNSFNQIAYRINKGGNLYDEDIAEIKKGVNEIWQLITSIRSTRERQEQLLISATKTKPQTAGLSLATCAYLLHKEQQSNSETQEPMSEQEKVELSVSI